MIKRLSENICDGIGNKASSLMELKRQGFLVPDGIVLSSNVFDTILKENNLKEQINPALKELNSDNVKKTSEKIAKCFENAIIPNRIVAEIEVVLDPKIKYAVRSSGLQEDLPDRSFAGQYNTFLNVSGTNDIKRAIIDCYKSMYSQTVLNYLLSHQTDTNNLKMAVIIQEMVEADVSGIAFTINPITGIDKEIVVEAAEGLGENIVGGKVVPHKYVYNWYSGTYENDNDRLLNGELLSEMMTAFLDIQVYFGYPCDIEFAVKNNVLYILQARPITKINYSNIQDQWTTADFKDGGVSATTCFPFMWSLYEYIWDIAFREYLNKAVLVHKKHLQKLGDMFFGRPYWNLTKAKQGMAKVIGYKEKEFDHELGVKITYEGDGNTTQITPASLVNVLRILMVNRRMTVTKLKNNQNLQNELLAVYDKRFAEKDTEITSIEFEKAWERLVFDDYLKSESNYFSQIFVNTIGQPIYKSNLKKYVSESAYLNLITGLHDISHLRPFNDLWSISRKIRDDAEAFGFWKKASIGEIKREYDLQSQKHYISELAAHIEKFGYHSDKELDVTHPHYSEDPSAVIFSLKDTVLLSDENSPSSGQKKQRTGYKNELDELKKRVSPFQYKRLIKKIDEMRKMLWWREEFRDTSTKYYFLIRLYTLKLAKDYAEQNIIDDITDIWYLKIEDIRRLINRDIDALRFKEIINKNKKYYRSFRNYVSENEIGSVFDREAVEVYENGLEGVGCNNGVVTGTARVVNDFSEIDKIQTGDILVTKYTDTGWTSKFAVLKGIVTEYGGTLCHSAIVSREYGIPCIVSASDITKKIKDGSTITINGTTGAVKIVKEQQV